MGILTDFVIAEAGQGPAIGESAHPSEQWPTLEGKGVGPVKLSSLYDAVSGARFSEKIDGMFNLVGGDEHEGPWVIQLPAQVVAALAEIDEANSGRIGSAWAETEELKADRWSSEDAATFASLLGAHCRNAVTDKKAVYLWMSP